jgi:hypothetical protein|tara:strand:- start:311 stop:844 length:534 start_codon:yes stop_codon:yes gene_type:complete
MAFNINEFKSQLTGGGARSNLFQVQILNPVDSTADFKVPFMASASTLPASSIASIDTIKYFGRTIKYAGERTFAQWSVTIINDEDFLVRNAMEAWMNGIASHDTNLQSLPQDYKSNALITQYSKSGDPLRTYKFEGLFPTEIAAQAMSWETDGIQSFDVTFSYDLWMVEGNTGIPTT